MAVKTKTERPSKRHKKGVARIKSKTKAKALSSVAGDTATTASEPSSLHSGRARSARAVQAPAEPSGSGATTLEEEEEEAPAALRDDGDDEYVEDEYDEFEVPVSEEDEEGSDYESREASTPPRRSVRGTKRKFST